MHTQYIYAAKAMRKQFYCSAVWHRSMGQAGPLWLLKQVCLACTNHRCQELHAITRAISHRAPCALTCCLTTAASSRAALLLRGHALLPCAHTVHSRAHQEPQLSLVNVLLDVLLSLLMDCSAPAANNRAYVIS